MTIDLSPIREWNAIDRAQLEQEVRPLRQPAIFRGHARDWPAVQAARRSPEQAVDYLKRFSQGASTSALVGPPEIGGRFFYTPDLKAFNFRRGSSDLDPFLDRLLRDRGNPRPYAMAVQSTPVPELLPGFTVENRTDLVDDGIVPRIWIGNAIQVATHYDLMENIGVVVAGRRRFTVFPPDQIANLYPGPFELTPAGTPISMVDHRAPDLAVYPRFADALAVGQTATLEPGDAIYLPYHWWHAVDSLDDVNAFVNYWWDPAPAAVGSSYDALLMALLALRPLPEDQRQVWRMLFDHYVFSGGEKAAAHLPEDVQGVLGPPDAARLVRMRLSLADRLMKSGR